VATATPLGPAAADSCIDGTVPDAEQAVMTGTHEWAPSEFTITVGTTITWTNSTTAPHTVTFVNGPDCGYVLGSKSVSVTFNTPGTFAFNDKIYPTFMFGTVTVTE
jgi:plastocyanin